MFGVRARWGNLSAIQKGTVVASLIVLFGVLPVLINSMLQPSRVLLYSGLDAGTSGEVVRSLEQRGVSFQIHGNSIFVPESERDVLRMTLASEGLPANSSKGYEILDSLSGFGTTSQMFNAAYIRALEGELARTIVSSPNFSSARVHIALPAKSSFGAHSSGGASVFVTPTGPPIDLSQARALQFLVGSAVSGLSSEDVAIVNERGELIGDEATLNKKPNHSERVDQLRLKVLRLLEARVGRGHAVVEVNVETINDTESIKERIFDPSGRVVISTETQERSDARRSAANGVSVASNLPDGDANASDSSNTEASETRERTNYEISETQREVTKSPGTIKRLSVAVLLNSEKFIEPIEGSEAQLPQAMAQISDLVKSAVGFDEARGDVVTIEAMPFLKESQEGTVAVSKPWFSAGLNPTKVIQVAVLAVTSILLGILVIKPILLPKDTPQTLALSSPSESEDLPMNPDFPSADEITILDPSDTSSFLDAATAEFTAEDLSPVQKLREMIDTRQDETVEVLRQWLQQKEDSQS